jgi:hypothetical protein
MPIGINRRWSRLLVTGAAAASAIAASLFVVAPAFASSTQQCENSSVVKICITQNYTNKYSGPTRYVKVQNYVVQATKLSSGVTITEFDTKEGVIGTCYPGSGCSDLSESWTDEVVTSATGPYTATPPWNQDYTRVDDAGGQDWYQCATVTLHYWYGNKPYAWTSKVCQGHNG